MQALWLLPNRDQSDDILASDGERILPFRSFLDPQLRPAGLSHGVPTELLERCGPQARAEILFAQKFPDWKDGRQLLSISSAAGTDSNGRIVHLGLLLILGPQEQPRFDLPYTTLSAQDQKYARALLDRLRSTGRRDLWAQSVRELSELPATIGPATNVELQRSAVRFYSQNVLTPDGVLRKRIIHAAPVNKIKIALIVLVAVVSIFLGERACMHLARPAIATGVP